MEDITSSRTKDVIGDASSFHDLLLPPKILHALSNAGYTRPSPVQQAAIPLARLHLDLIIQAKAGTGKTLVFAVAIVERIDTTNPFPQALVLAPTREVALQAAAVVADVAATTPFLKIATLIGGLPTAEDERVLRRRCHVVIGTPGRVLALIQKGTLQTSSITLLALDEADKLTAPDFWGPVSTVIDALPPKKQFLALSATYTAPTRTLIASLMTSPRHILVSSNTTSLLGITHYYMDIGNNTYENKRSHLFNILSSIIFYQAIVFCGTRGSAEALAADLHASGHAAACLSADKDQLERIDVLNSLRNFSLRIVVATDVAARGIDLDRVNLVVNFDVLVSSTSATSTTAATHAAATLMHRVGRAGRFGTRGIAISMVAGEEERGELERAVAGVAGGKVLPLPDPIPVGWNASSPASIADGGGGGGVPTTYRNEGDRVVVMNDDAAAPFIPMDMATNQQRKLDTNTNTVHDNDKQEFWRQYNAIMTTSLWPEGIESSWPTPAQWPLPDTMNSSSPPLPRTHTSTSTMHHFEAVVDSVRLDVCGDHEEAITQLTRAFDFLFDTTTGVGDGNGSDDGTEAFVDQEQNERKRRPLGSTQSTAYARQVMYGRSNDMKQTIEQEAALLESMAFGDGSGGDVDVDVDDVNEDAWRQYWCDYYRVYGHWPGGGQGEEEQCGGSSAAAFYPMDGHQGSNHEPSDAPSSPYLYDAVGGWSPSRQIPPDVDAIVAACTDDTLPPQQEEEEEEGGGYVRVPEGLLRRYLALEWQERQRRGNEE